MGDRPILFSAPMVRALLDGRKTQTRRALPKVPMFSPEYDRDWRPHVCPPGGSIPDAWSFWEGPWHGPSCYHTEKLRFAVGDRLYVREHWKTHAAYDDLSPRQMGGEEPIQYQADGAHQTWGYPAINKIGRFRQGMHMPRWASRLTLLVTEVRVERLQDCSEADAIAEGVPTDDDYPGSFAAEYCQKCGGSGVHGALGSGGGATEVDCSECATPQLRYRNLWDSINGPGSWATNPWVVAISFTVHQVNIDAMEAAGWA